MPNQETPAGTVDGVNDTFTTAGTITNELITVDRLTQASGVDYNISGNTITFTAGSVPQPGATIRIWYTVLPTPAVNPGVTSLGAITLQAQQRADMVHSQLIGTAEWYSMVNASCQALYDKLIEAYGSDYEVASAYSITTDGTNDHFALPDDFYKLLGVDLQISNAGSSNTGWVTLRRFNLADRNKYTLPNIQTLWGRTNLLYRLSGSDIWFIPLPAASMPIRIWYAPRFTPLVNAGDTFDGINGWEEWVVNDVAMKARVKEESPIDGIQALQAVQNDRLASIMENRDAGTPATVTDVTSINGGDYGEWMV